MMTDAYLDRSRVLRGLKKGPLGEHIRHYVGWLRRGGYSAEVAHRHLSIVRDLASGSPRPP